MVLLSFQAAQFPHFQQCLVSRRRIGSIVRCGIAEPSGEPAPVGQKTLYKDGFFEKAFMTLFARKMEKFAGTPKNKKSKGWLEYDYESFVEVSKKVTQGRSRVQQQEVVREVLLSMLPPGAPDQFRKLFPQTKWVAEFNAALTVPFFHWLVGPSEVVEVEIDGVRQKSGVHIKKCRYRHNSRRIQCLSSHVILKFAPWQMTVPLSVLSYKVEKILILDFDPFCDGDNN